MCHHVGLSAPPNLVAHKNSVTMSEQFPQQYAVMRWIKNHFPALKASNFTKYS